MSNLAQQAAAGVRSELLPLMQITQMTGARARALFAGGILSPQDLALSDEEAVRQAVESSLPKMAVKSSAAQPSVDADRSKAPRYLKTDPAYLTRAAKTLIQSAREHIVEEAQRAALTVCLQRKTDHPTGTNESDKLEEETAATADELIITLLPSSTLASMSNLSSYPPPVPQPPVTMNALRGRAKITEISSSTDPEFLNDVLRDLKQQQTIAIAVSINSKSSQEASALGRAFENTGQNEILDPNSSLSLSSLDARRLPDIPVAAIWSNVGLDEDSSMDTYDLLDAPPSSHSQGIAIAWRHNECLFFHLTPLDPSDRHPAYLEQVWSTVRLFLHDPLISKCIFGLRESLSSLLSLQSQWLCEQESNIKPCGPILDPQLMFWCVNPSDNDLSLRHVLQAILPQYAIQVPASRDPGVTMSCRLALASFSLARPLMSLLVTSSAESDANPSSVYDKVEVALSIAMAHSAAVPKCRVGTFDFFTQWLLNRIREIDESAGIILGAREKIDLSLANPQLKWICHHTGLYLKSEKSRLPHLWNPDPLSDFIFDQTGDVELWRPIEGLSEADNVRARLMSLLIQERAGLSSLLARTLKLGTNKRIDLVPCISTDGSLATYGCDTDLIFPSNAAEVAFHSQTLLASLKYSLGQRLQHQRGGIDAWNGSRVMIVIPYGDGKSEGIFHGTLSSISLEGDKCHVDVWDPEDADGPSLGRSRPVEVPSSCTWLLMHDACGSNALSTSVIDYLNANGSLHPTLVPTRLKLSPLDHVLGPVITIRFPSLYLSGLAFHSSDPTLLSVFDRQGDPWAYLMDYWLGKSPDCKILHAISSQSFNSTFPWPPPPLPDVLSHPRPSHDSLPRIYERDLARTMVDSIAQGEGPKKLALRLSSTLRQGGYDALLNSSSLCSFSRKDAISLMSSFLEAFPGVAKHRADLTSSYFQGKSIQSVLHRPLHLRLTCKNNSASSSIQARIGREIQSAQVKLFSNEVIRAATATTLNSFSPDVFLLWSKGGAFGLQVVSSQRGLQIFEEISETISPNAVYTYLNLPCHNNLPSWLVSTSISKNIAYDT